MQRRRSVVSGGHNFTVSTFEVERASLFRGARYRGGILWRIALGEKDTNDFIEIGGRQDAPTHVLTRELKLLLVRDTNEPEELLISFNLQ